MSAHLGTEIPALVDGELDHAARERALGHLAGCAACRAEVDDERRLKARLRGVGATGPRPADELAERLRRLAESAPPALPPGPRLLPDASRLAPAPLPTVRTPARTDGRTAGSHPARGAVLGGAVLVVGLGAVLALGGPSRPPTRPLVDPTSDAFVADFAGTGSRPLTGPVRTASVGAR